MNKLLILILSFFAMPLTAQTNAPVDKKIFIHGSGGPHKEFVKYTATLTGKKKPRICYLPTASGDNPTGIMRFYQTCSSLEVEPHVMRVWINSHEQKESWEDILLSMDAIIVGGGNTLNMMAIWRAQGIDIALKIAYDRGIVLAGGSAGSLAWFVAGTTDSRPKELTIVECLGFLKYSHCPHYNSEPARRPLYHHNILTGKLSPGYACDDRSGILFVNGIASQAVSMDATSHSYFVSVLDGKIVEEKLDAEIIK
ncbi:MAG: peptidase E [Saprospiraceae bacterium]